MSYLLNWFSECEEWEYYSLPSWFGDDMINLNCFTEKYKKCGIELDSNSGEVYVMNTVYKFVNRTDFVSVYTVQRPSTIPLQIDRSSEMTNADFFAPTRVFRYPKHWVVTTFPTTYSQRNHFNILDMKLYTKTCLPNCYEVLFHKMTFRSTSNVRICNKYSKIIYWYCPT